MSKKFITVIAEQINFESRIYDCGDDKRLEYNRKTHYPIANVIYNAVEDGETIEVVAVKKDGITSDKNLDILKSDLDCIEKEKNIQIKYSIITRPKKETKRSHIEYFYQLINEIKDNDLIYADITYGTKPGPFILFAALNYANRLKKNVGIESIVYGGIDWDTKHSYIYDVTQLFYMNSIVETIAAEGVEEAEKVVETLFKMM